MSEPSSGRIHIKYLILHKSFASAILCVMLFFTCIQHVCTASARVIFSANCEVLRRVRGKKPFAQVVPISFEFTGSLQGDNMAFFFFLKDCRTLGFPITDFKMYTHNKNNWLRQITSARWRSCRRVTRNRFYTPFISMARGGTISVSLFAISGRYSRIAWCSSVCELERF